MARSGIYHYRFRYKNRTYNPFLLAAWLLTVVVLGGLSWSALRPKPSPLPASISQKIVFAAVIPGKPWVVYPGSYRYDSKAQVLNFTATDSAKSITFTEQAAPSQFNDIPQYYPALLNKLNQYRTLSTANGVVNLTRPTELKGEQEAVLTTGGTLIFAHPDNPMTDADWRRLFNSANIVKT